LAIADEQTDQQFVSRRNPSRPKGRPRGRPFPKGRSGNPGGRPAGPPKAAEQKMYDADVRTLAREHGPDAIKKLSEIMRDGNAQLKKIENEVIAAPADLSVRVVSTSATAPRNTLGSGGVCSTIFSTRLLCMNN
jgi:hypothetical protein